MFQTYTKNREDTSSELIQVETKTGLALTEGTFRRFRNLFLSGPTEISGLAVLIEEDRRMGEKTYLVDFRYIFERVGPAADAFYFYPHELEGFIESCVMATQREVDVSTRDVQIFREMNDAMAEWLKKEEEATVYSGFTFNRNYSVEEYEIREATKLGALIDEMVHNAMSIIRDVHGDYAIDERSLEWTSLRALKMRLRF